MSRLSPHVLRRSPLQDQQHDGTIGSKVKTANCGREQASNVIPGTDGMRNFQKHFPRESIMIADAQNTGGPMFEAPLSMNEREALSRFVSKIIDDVEKVATLFESRGADAGSARAAQRQLKSTLESLKTWERIELKMDSGLSGRI